MPVTTIIVTIALLTGVGLMIYSKVTKNDETKNEKIIEKVIETQLENSFNLPSGSLDGKIDFMVQPVDIKNEDTRESK